MLDFLEVVESAVVEVTCRNHRTVAGFRDVS